MSVPPAVLLAKLMSLAVKPVTVSLKATVKLIGLVLVGSACPAAWLIVTLGATLSNATVLSVLVDARLRLPAASVAAPAGTLTTTLPAPLIPDTATL